MRRGITCVGVLFLVVPLLLAFLGGTGTAQQLPGVSSIGTTGGARPPGGAESLSPQPVGVEQIKNLTSEQQGIVQKQIDKQGGSLSPEAIKELKSRPDFQGLSAEDIAKGKELLNKRETETDKKDVDKKPAEIITKQVPGGTSGRPGTLFDRMKKIGGYQEISTDLKPFGYDFFQDAATKISSQRQDIPVPASYVVGPGDEVKILLWGRVNEQYNLVVDKNGNITIPQIGPVFVAGSTFEQMSVNVIQQVEKIIGASVNITMGTLKSIPVFILGDVVRPGAYTVGSFATITDALLIAGGPSGIGSMRHVELKRKGKVVTNFDLYDLLLKGDKSKDAMLQAGDVVFVPVTGPLAGIAGNVKRPAIYELKGKQDLHTVIELAGGILPTAYTQQIQVERIVKNERQVVIDIDDKRLSSTRDFLVSDADLIKVFNIAGKEENIIILAGNVKRPGKYEYRSGMRVRELIRDVSDLQYETNFDYALIKRLASTGSNYETELIPFNLGRLLFGKDESQNIELKPQDNVYVFSKWFFMDKPSFTVDGGVRSGGEFSLVENTRVRDAILLAGGIARGASLADAELYRVDPIAKSRTIVRVNLKKALEGDPEHNLPIRDLDRLTVKKLGDHGQEQLVSIDGEVVHPGRYAFKKGDRLSAALERAGGYSENAYLKGAIFTRTRVREMQQKALTEMVLRLERELYVEGSVQDTSATPEARKVELEQRKKFIDSLRKMETTGRMSIKLVHLRLLKGSAFDIELENGDVLNIPTKNSVVNVAGAVMSQGSFVYLDNMDYKGYIDIAGGFTRYADQKGIFVLKADGTARRVNGGFMNWSQANSRWELAAFSEDQSELNPGDTIIVPEKLERTAWLRELKDWTQVLMQISVIGATVNYMFK